ncbi:hypothetical protein RB195_016270 [Necator americanus]|uniref:G-protein coupled receptors family 1 profile domain-containing protein n=1 Tax=Necator americanus TaxID=51031 RepID=A0ABR1E8D8_NECAM
MNLFRYVQKRLLLLQAMSLYINLPWIINERDYNCSGRTVSEWLARGQIDYVQGIYFAVSGSIFLVFYLLTLIVIYRESMLDHSCYRLMFFGGVIDVICLIIGSHLTAYFHIRGTVFCSDPLLDQFAGHSTWSLWNGIPIFVPRIFRQWLDAIMPILYASQAVYYTPMSFQLKNFVVFLSSTDIRRYCLGIHGIIYMAMNQQIRRGVWSLLRRGRTGAKSSSVGSLVKTHKKEHEITNHASAQ